MERNIKVLKQKPSKFDNINPKYSPLRHSIQLKSKKETKKKIPIEKVEFVFEESNPTTPRKNIIKHIYKEKENIMNLISKEINNQKKKKIKNQKSNTIYPVEKRVFNIIKRYANGKQSTENNTASFKRVFPMSFKNITNIAKEKLMHKSQSNPSINNSQEMNMESNFMKLSKEANIYTANATYIKNKKVLLFDKFVYDNNQYVPDRVKLFDMTRMLKKPKKDSFIYKTTKFRAGHLINGNNNTYDFGKKNNFNNSSLIELNLQKEIKQNKISNNNEYNNKNIQFRNNYGNNGGIPYSYLDNTFQKSKRHPPSDTFYKELMSKKNETYEQYFKKIVDFDKENENEKEVNTEDYIESSDVNENNENEIIDKNKDSLGFLQPYYKSPKNKKSPEVKQLYYKQMLRNGKSDLNGYSPLLSKKKDNMGQPIHFPKILSSNINFENHSQKQRFEKISESFEGLKNLMEKFKRGELNELDFIYEYALSKNIDKNLLGIKNLNNFYNFLHEKHLPLDTNKSLKENIILALNYDINIKEEKNKKNNFKKIFTKKKEIVKNKNKANELKEIKKLMLDLNLQKKLSNQENYSVDKIHIRDELKKEIAEIKNEVINKQKLIENIRNEEKIKNYEHIYDSNERLYYTWYKNKNEKDINNFRKNSKLTELYFYNKAKEEIKKNDLEQQFLLIKKK